MPPVMGRREDATGRVSMLLDIVLKRLKVTISTILMALATCKPWNAKTLERALSYE